MAGLEIESIDEVGASIDGIITGKIESIEKHPNADKLVITSILMAVNITIVTGVKQQWVTLYLLPCLVQQLLLE